MNNDDKEKQMHAAKLDQQLANVRENLPRLWWAVFIGCKEAGFTEEQAMRCLLEFIAKPIDNV